MTKARSSASNFPELPINMTPKTKRAQKGQKGPKRVRPLWTDPKGLKGSEGPKRVRPLWTDPGGAASDPPGPQERTHLAEDGAEHLCALRLACIVAWSAARLAPPPHTKPASTPPTLPRKIGDPQDSLPASS